jgi:hypothetical protein
MRRARARPVSVSTLLVRLGRAGDEVPRCIARRPVLFVRRGAASIL